MKKEKYESDRKKREIREARREKRYEQIFVLKNNFTVEGKKHDRRK